MCERSAWLYVALPALVITAAFTQNVLTAQEKTRAPNDRGFSPAAPHHFLMEWHDKAFNDLNLALSKEKQDAAAQNAWLLAELANVNTQHSEQSDYRQWASEVRTGAAEAAAAIAAKDYKTAKNAAKRINTTCQACHDKYEKEWKK